MNKKNYLAPLVEMIAFHEDIVRTSVPSEVDGMANFNRDWLPE